MAAPKCSPEIEMMLAELMHREIHTVMSRATSSAQSVGRQSVERGDVRKVIASLMENSTTGLDEEMQRELAELTNKSGLPSVEPSRNLLLHRNKAKSAAPATGFPDLARQAYDKDEAETGGGMGDVEMSDEQI
uniref:Uncharacterized protein n=1 Tax=Chromera velia CCMP2878 TaxID=1169474 RepID=A0A0G4FV50_9ALVE|eukprot:Cvel_3787.t1-p1 / transcript=Cvel_3787.t1 / gene=Cvel_3787 / organism=Chromera_velia_CCMP2878 / gene_product=hypothetical protein / transcript_product=hypothetical protein / location=Cvel_scaffold159:37497-39479(-) / protein_length=132 / sequence_SO=supercontig / SO=protein_coding / is_pseudo=false